MHWNRWQKTATKSLGWNQEKSHKRGDICTENWGSGVTKCRNKDGGDRMKKSLQVEEIHMSFLKLPVIKHPSYTIDNISAPLVLTKDYKIVSDWWILYQIKYFVSESFLCISLSRTCHSEFYLLFCLGISPEYWKVWEERSCLLHFCASSLQCLVHRTH